MTNNLQTVCLKFRQTDYPRWSGLDRVCGFQYIHYSSKSFPCNLSCSEVGESQTLCGTVGVSSLTFNFQINALWVWKKALSLILQPVGWTCGIRKVKWNKSLFCVGLQIRKCKNRTDKFRTDSCWTHFLGPCRVNFVLRPCYTAHTPFCWLKPKHLD